MSARRSHLVTSLRSWASHARVRSTTHRCRPSLVEVSTPLRAIRGAMDRARHSPRHRRPSQALSAWSLPGRLRGRPRCPDRAPGTASSVGAGAMLSWRFAPVRVRPSGAPRRSVTQCRLVPGRPRSVGFGPISAPPFLPRWRQRPARHETSPTRPPGRGVRGAPSAAGPTPPRSASPAGVASRSGPSSRTPRAAASPMAGQSAARTRSHARHRGPAPAGGLRLRRLPRQKRFHHLPHLVRHKIMPHDTRLHETQISFVGRSKLGVL